MPAEFLTPLLLADDSDGRHMTLHDPLIYRRANGQVINVPRGFRTDFASVPRPLWNVLPPHGRYSRAAVVHDYLYRTNGCTRAEADAVFHEAMRVCGVSWWVAATMYLGVRVGGGGIWDRLRKEQG